MRIWSIVTQYEHRRHIKFLDLNGIEKDLVVDEFINEILSPHNWFNTLVVKIVLPIKETFKEVFCQKAKLEVAMTGTVMVYLIEDNKTKPPSCEMSGFCHPQEENKRLHFQKNSTTQAQKKRVRWILSQGLWLPLKYYICMIKSFDLGK